MNLHDESIGSVFWTQAMRYRVRLEFRCAGTDLFECTLFDFDGEPVRTIRYRANGKPYHSARYNRDLALIKPTTH